MSGRENARRRVLSVLEADSDLAMDLDEEQTRAARAQLTAPVLTVEWRHCSERWGPDENEGLFGLLIAEGVLMRQIALLGSFSAEILGPGDLIWPWDIDGGYTLPAGTQVSWRSLAPTTLAVLDPEFLRRAGHWPTVIARLAGRARRRVRAVALQDAITNLKHVETRLLVEFSQLAERFGRVGPSTIAIRLPLTHEMLAKLVGATRPSVTTALRSLAERGLLTRDEADVWQLRHEAAAALEPLPVRPETELVA